MSLTFSPRSSLRERFRPLWWLGIFYVVLGAITRVALLVMTGKGVPHDPLDWLYAFGVGLCSDLITLLYVAWPLLLFLWIVPSRRPLVVTAKQWAIYIVVLAALYALTLLALHLAIHAAIHDVWPVIAVFIFFLPMPALCYNALSGQRGLYVLCLLMLFGLLFVAAAELVFWDEFGVRFNFIAVDYLVYTTEVVGQHPRVVPDRALAADVGCCRYRDPAAVTPRLAHARWQYAFRTTRQSGCRVVRADRGVVVPGE